MRFPAIGVALLVSGCVSSSEPQAPNYQTELTAYQACNMRAAIAASSQPGEPQGLAIAARGMCLREASVLRARVATTRNIPTTDAIMRIFEAGAVEANMTDIVRARAIRATPRTEPLPRRTPDQRA